MLTINEKPRRQLLWQIGSTSGWCTSGIVSLVNARILRSKGALDKKIPSCIKSRVKHLFKAAVVETLIKLTLLSLIVEKRQIALLERERENKELTLCPVTN